MRRLTVVTPLVLALVWAATAGGCSQPAANHIRGLTVADAEGALVGLGYTCQFLRGVDHSLYRCHAGAPGTDGSGVVDIDYSGDFVDILSADGCGVAGNDQVRLMFETVARLAFPADGRSADRAAAWVDANLDDRKHQMRLGGYLYTTGVSTTDGCVSLGIIA